MVDWKWPSIEKEMCKTLATPRWSPQQRVAKICQKNLGGTMVKSHAGFGWPKSSSAPSCNFRRKIANMLHNGEEHLQNSSVQIRNWIFTFSHGLFLELQAYFLVLSSSLQADWACGHYVKDAWRELYSKNVYAIRLCGLCRWSRGSLTKEYFLIHVTGVLASYLAMACVLLAKVQKFCIYPIIHGLLTSFQRRSMQL